MKKISLFKKSLVLGVIILFMGAGFIPIISGNKEIKTTSNNNLNDYIRYDDFEDYSVGEPPKSSRGWSTSGVTSNQYIEARVDPLDSGNMVMLIHSSSSDPNIYCELMQIDFGPASRYAVHLKIYTPQLSMTNTIYELFREENVVLTRIHRRTGEIRWGGDECGGYQEFNPFISPSTSRWIEEEVRVTPDEFRVWYDNSIDALGGYCVSPISGIDTWKIFGYKDSNQNFYIDDFWIKFYSRPPDAPHKPSGQTNGSAGKEYTYTTYTSDPDDDQVLYKWEWGDGTYSEWIGPHESGDLTSASHSWKQGSYSIRVKAKDIYEYESDWSEPLVVTMPRNKVIQNTMFLWFLEQSPILIRLFQRLISLQ